MGKSCYTCHYHSVIDGKLGCSYSGICHSMNGEKTAYKPMRGSVEEQEMFFRPIRKAMLMRELEVMNLHNDLDKQLDLNLLKPKFPQILSTENPKSNSWMESFMSDSE